MGGRCTDCCRVWCEAALLTAEAGPDLRGLAGEGEALTGVRPVCEITESPLEDLSLGGVGGTMAEEGLTVIISTVCSGITIALSLTAA